MRRRDLLSLSGAALMLPACSLAHAAAPMSRYWRDVFARMPPAIAALASLPEHAVQLRCVRVARDADGALALRTEDHGLAPERWFSPASVAKLPMALLMAERLSQHGLDQHASIRLAMPPVTGEWPAGEPLQETFRRGLQRTFAVSENIPYNRWYEFLGVDAIHARLAQRGYPHARLIARYASPDPQANRRTGGGVLLAPDGRQVETRAPALGDERVFPFGPVLLGRGWQRGDGGVDPGPHDFSRANFLPLADSLAMLQAFLLPDTVPARRRWRIDGALRMQLLHALGLRPRDADDPRYDEGGHPDGYARWFLVGDGKARYPDGVRVFGKSGQAYGFLSEVAYVVDRAGGAEFMLAAVIHANADGIYNDDRYEYDSVALPFMASVGRAVLEVERLSKPRGPRIAQRQGLAHTFDSADDRRSPYGRIAH